MKKFISLFIFLLFITEPDLTQAQNTAIDSMHNLIKNDKPDSNKVKHLNTIAVMLWDNLDSAIAYSSNALALAKKVEMDGNGSGWQKGIAQADHQLGMFYFDKGDYSRSLTYNLDALSIWEQLEQKATEPELHQLKFAKAKSLGEIGNDYWGQGNYPKALESQLKALKIQEELKNEKAVGNIYGNMGNIYGDQKNFTKALEYYTKSLKVGQKLGNKNDMSIDMRNIGSVYKNLSNYKKSMEYFMMALVLSKELNNSIEVASNLCSVGAAIQNEAEQELKKGASISEIKPQLDKAMDYYIESNKLMEEQGNQMGSAMNFANIGGIYFDQKNYKEAEKYFMKGLAIDTALGILNQAKNMHEFLSTLYAASGDYKKSLLHYKLFSDAKDSLFNEEKDKEITRHEMNFEFDKKEAALQAEQNKKEAIAESDKKRQNIFFWLVSLVAIAIAIIAIVIFRSLRITNRQKNIIEQQKEIVEEKQREILDSIHYAKRIQESLLPNEKYIQKNLQRLNKKS